MQKLTLAQVQSIMNSGKFFTIQGYKKADGETVSINARTGVQKRTKGGVWNGNPAVHMLVAKPARGAQRNAENEKPFNGFRTLKRESLIGCTLAANGQQYEIIA